MKVFNDLFKLNNGIEIPMIGFGTWQIKEGDEAYKSTLLALKNGYRHIDTAAIYGNEKSIGKAIKDSKIPRKDIFVTTKLSPEVKTYEETKIAFDKSLKDLDLEYIDLYLIHTPWSWNKSGNDCNEGNNAVYRAMEELYLKNKIKAIGISNFMVKDIKTIIENNSIIPMVNQIRYSIGLNQSEVIEYCKKNDIFIVAYSPLDKGHLLKNKYVRKMADKYHVSSSQICLRYLIQKGVGVIPKAVHENYMKENLQLNFHLDEKDMIFLDFL